MKKQKSEIEKYKEKLFKKLFGNRREFASILRNSFEKQASLIYEKLPKSNWASDPVKFKLSENASFSFIPLDPNLALSQLLRFKVRIFYTNPHMCSGPGYSNTYWDEFKLPYSTPLASDNFTELLNFQSLEDVDIFMKNLINGLKDSANVYLKGEIQGKILHYKKLKKEIEAWINASERNIDTFKI